MDVRDTNLSRCSACLARRARLLDYLFNPDGEAEAPTRSADELDGAGPIVTRLAAYRSLEMRTTLDNHRMHKDAGIEP